MPRRRAPHCTPRGLGDEVLGLPEELMQCFGYDYNLSSLGRSHDAFRRHWAFWRDRLLPRYRLAYPGSYPIASYLFDGVPTPDLVSPPQEVDFHTLRLDRVTLDYGFHRKACEVEHLLGLGLITKSEANKGLALIEEDDHFYSYDRYDLLSRSYSHMA